MNSVDVEPTYCKFQSSATGRHYPIRQKLSCSSKNVIYLARCCKCNLQYVGSTSTEFKIRFRNHKSNMLNNRRTCELAVHYNSSQHDISQINFIIIEQITSFQNPLHLDQLLLTREAYWMTQLFTLRRASIKGGNFTPKIALITATNYTLPHVLALIMNCDLSSSYFIH